MTARALTRPPPLHARTYYSARALKSLLDREQLFTTQAGQALCEVGARGNMRDEYKLAFAGRLLDATPLAEETEGE